MATSVRGSHPMGSLLLAATLAAAGCGSEKPTGTVTGKVTYNGAPVKSGSVNFLSATGAADMAKIDEAGNYKLGPVEAGNYKVYLLPPIPEQLPPGAKQPPPPAKFEVPKKFQDPAGSGLTATVKAGPNDIPIDVK